MEWIDRSQIAGIAGARKPGAYVARARRHAYAHSGELPEWAQKPADGRWRFSREYIEADARLNLESMTAGEAARLVGVSRRAMQNWIDEGMVPLLEAREDGEVRRISRERFESILPSLKERAAGPEADAGVRSEYAGSPRRRARRRRQEGDGESEISAPELETQARLAEETLEETARARRSAERRARAAAAAETRMLAALDRRIADAMSDLAAARRERREVIKDRKELAREERELTRAEKSAAKRAEELKRKLDELSKQEVVQEVAGIEAQLLAATSQREKEVAWEDVAERIAERITNTMFDDDMDRIDAISLYNRLAKEDGVPRPVRINVRKKFFGR